VVVRAMQGFLIWSAAAAEQPLSGVFWPASAGRLSRAHLLPSPGITRYACASQAADRRHPMQPSGLPANACSGAFFHEGASAGFAARVRMQHGAALAAGVDHFLLGLGDPAIVGQALGSLLQTNAFREGAEDQPAQPGTAHLHEGVKNPGGSGEDQCAHPGQEPHELDDEPG